MVKLYTAPWCGYCPTAKRFLTNKGVEFEEVNVDNNPKAAEAIMAALGRILVPAVEINGQIVEGLNWAAINRLLITI